MNRKIKQTRMAYKIIEYGYYMWKLGVCEEEELEKWQKMSNEQLAEILNLLEEMR